MVDDEAGNATVDDVSEVEKDYVSEELHTPCSSEDERQLPVWPQYEQDADYGEVYLELGMEFATLDQFKQAVRDFNIFSGREFYFVKNDQRRCRARCRSKECKWEIYCAISSVTRSYQVKTFHDQHTCPRVYRNKRADTNWVVSKLVHRLRTQPNMTHAECFQFMKDQFEVHLDDTKVYRSLKKAKEILRGNEEKQYAQLWDYCEEVQKTNPGTTIDLDTIPVTTGMPRFHRLYICFEACKEGFKKGCRPLIGLDGCFLKGLYGGQLLSAVGQDANNHLFVIAFAVVDIENKDNWTWFLQLLHSDLGWYKDHGWTFISDMQKVLIS